MPQCLLAEYRARFALMLGLSLVACALFLLSSLAFANEKSEYETKARFLYNFIKFIDWPNAAQQGDIKICTSGPHPINEQLKTHNPRVIKDSRISVAPLSSTSSFTDCDVLFVAAEGNRQIRTLLEEIAASKAAVLTVSDHKNFIDMGGTIGFVTLGKNIRFDVNLACARKAGISVSSKLLELAYQVRQ